LLVLGIETSGSEVSFALGDRPNITREAVYTTSFDLSQHIITWIDALFTSAGCSPADLTAIGVSLGPGGWTGLRVGVATAKALAQGLCIPLVGVPTFTGLACALASEVGEGTIVPLACGRHNEVLAQVYRVENGDVVAQREPRPYSIPSLCESMKNLLPPVTLCGEGFLKHQQELAAGFPASRDTCPAVCRAGMIMARLRRDGVDRPLPALDEIKPLYLMPSQAERQAGIVVTG